MNPSALLHLVDAETRVAVLQRLRHLASQPSYGREASGKQRQRGRKWYGTHVPVGLRIRAMGEAIGRTGCDKRPIKERRQTVSRIDIDTILTISQLAEHDVHVTAVQGQPRCRLIGGWSGKRSGNNTTLYKWSALWTRGSDGLASPLKVRVGIESTATLLLSPKQGAVHDALEGVPVVDIGKIEQSCFSLW